MKNRAFTLSEVLITLGIIGVISAITLPAVINEFQHQHYLTALKKAYSILQQAENNIYVDYGMNSVFICNSNDSYCLVDIYKEYLKIGRIEKYIPNRNPEKCFGTIDVPHADNKHACIFTTDGIIYDFDMENANTTMHNAYINIDINGLKGPNKYGKDRYMFQIRNNKVAPFYDNRSLCNNGKGSTDANLHCAYVYLTKNSAK